MFSVTWSPGIGDPTWIGWLITLGYFAAVLLCFDAFRREPPQTHGKRLWLALAIGMLLLGLNKQLDLQTLLVQVGRQVAHQEGWFDQRRKVQAAFAAVIAVVSLVSSVRIFLIARNQRSETRLSLVGLVILIAFVVMRSATFEHVGPRLGKTINAVMELGGIACVALGAWRRRRFHSVRRGDVAGLL